MKSNDAFAEYVNEAEDSANQIAAKIKDEQKTRRYVSLREYELERIRDAISGVIAEDLRIDESNPDSRIDREKIAIEIEEPPLHVEEDLACPMFKLATSTGLKNPAFVAGEVAKIINARHVTGIAHAFAKGPYVNIKLDAQVLYANILRRVSVLGNEYGESNAHAQQIAVFDYSSPNIAKPIGVGHLRSTVIGESLARIYEATGYSVVRDNHLGDWGTQFGKLIYAFEHWGGGMEQLQSDPLTKLKDLYVRFNAEAAARPELEDEARALFKKLEEHDSRLVALWKAFRDMSIAGFEKVYALLNIHFDTYIGESFFSDEAQRVTDACVEKGIARKEEGAATVIVDSLEGVPSFLLRKQDGSSLYVSRDLATLEFRVKKFNPNTIVYVVGSEQALNFKQLFALARSYGLPDIAKHIDFGMVLSGGKKMSTRKGTLIELEDLVDEAVAKAKNIIEEKNPSTPAEEVAVVARQIGIGAIVYNDLRQSRQQNISFDWEKMLNFEHGSASYLQYSCVRISSILKRLEESRGVLAQAREGEVLIFEAHEEFALAKKLMFFPAVITKAQQFGAPHVIAWYLDELAQLFNAFYANVSVAETKDEALLRSRVLLISSVRTVLQKGLALLNIEVPTRM